jgi:hypothetical protein
MLVDNTDDGTMALWWVSNGQLTGANIGHNWTGIASITNGDFTSNGAGMADFLVTNLNDKHLYNWWIDADNHLQGIDLGAAWNNVGFIGTGKFTANGGTNILVNNTVDNHLYDWWIDPASNTLQGYDLGAYWSNIGFIAAGKFTTNGGGNDNFLVFNTASSLIRLVDRSQQPHASGI